MVDSGTVGMGTEHSACRGVLHVYSGVLHIQVADGGTGTQMAEEASSEAQVIKRVALSVESACEIVSRSADGLDDDGRIVRPTYRVL